MKHRTLGMLRIHKVAEATGLSVNTVRYLERKGIIKSQRDINGWRLFDPSVVPLIQRLYPRAPEGLAQSQAAIDRVVRMATIPDGEVISNGPVLYAVRIEAMCVCEHRFSRHSRGPTAIACMDCDCAAWSDHHLTCYQCATPLVAAEGGCEMIDALAWSPKQKTYIHIVMNVCGENPNERLIMKADELERMPEGAEGSDGAS